MYSLYSTKYVKVKEKEKWKFQEAKSQEDLAPSLKGREICHQGQHPRCETFSQSKHFLLPLVGLDHLDSFAF